MSDKDPQNSEDLKRILEENIKKYRNKEDESNTSSSSSSSNSSNKQSNFDDEFDDLGRTKENRNSDSSSNKKDFSQSFGNFFKTIKKTVNNSANSSNFQKSNNDNDNNSGSGLNFTLNKKAGFWGVGIVAVFILAGITIADGFYTVNESERGVVTRFGKYIETTYPGLNWRIPLIEDVKLVNVQQVNQFHIGGIVLTQDANLVNVAMNIQYRIDNPVNYLFNVDTPIATLQKAAEASLRYTIGHMDMNAVLTTGRGAVRQDTLQNLLSTLQRYNMGVEIVSVNFQYARPPEQVKAAFDDAIKAQEDEERFKREANAYMLAQLPIARGKAQQIINQAQAYAKQIVYKAEGAQILFDNLLPAYYQDPSLFKERYYLTNMASILQATPKIIVEKGVNLNFLSLDSLFNKKPDLSNGKLLYKSNIAPNKDQINLNTTTVPNFTNSPSNTANNSTTNSNTDSNSNYSNSNTSSSSSSDSNNLYSIQNSYNLNNTSGSNNSSYGSSYNSNNTNSSPSTFDQEYYGSKGGN